MFFICTIGFLGIDVYEQEESLFYNGLSENIIQDELILRLISFPNILITSHQGFLTNEALNEIAKATIKNISNFEKNIKTKNEVSINNWTENMTFLFLNIFTVVKIGKRVENRKPCGRFVGKHFKIEFSTVSLSFMTLFSLHA